MRLHNLTMGFVATIAAMAPAPRAQTEGPGPSIVSVDGRRLIVQKRNPDGTLAAPEPYTIRGVGWSPASRDTDTDKNDVDNARKRRPEFEKWYLTDIPLMKAMNVNTVRLFIDPGVPADLGASGRAVLDELYRNGIMVAMTVDDGINDLDRLQDAVSYYKDHPALLMWMLGSEWNLNLYFGVAASPQEAAARTEQAARMIKSLDSRHPVATSYGELHIDEDGKRFSDTMRYVQQECQSVDVWALNVYRGCNFGTLFEEWQSITTKPMLLGEFGTDAFETTSYPPLTCPLTGRVNEAAQAQWDVDLWNDLFRNLSSRDSAKPALGGFVAFWNDEWWKVPQSNSQENCGHDKNKAGHPDQIANEEFFGIVDIDRHVRQVHAALKAAFDPAYRPKTRFRAVSQGASSTLGFAEFLEDCNVLFHKEGGAGGGRGFNVAAFDLRTGVLLDPPQNFDTWLTRDSGTAMEALVAYLEGLPDGTLLMLAVGDDAGLTVDQSSCTTRDSPWTQDGLRVLEALGSREIQDYCFRDSWAMVTVKGEARARDEKLGRGVTVSAETEIALPPGRSVFDNGEWVVLVQEEDPGIPEDKMQVFLNGDLQGDAKLIQFQNKTETGRAYPQVAVVASSGFVRLKSGADPSPPLPFGQSLVLGPALFGTSSSFPATTLFFNPQIQAAYLDTTQLRPDGTGNLAIRLEAKDVGLDPQSTKTNQVLDLNWLLTLYEPKDVLTQMDVAGEFTLTEDVSLDPVRTAEFQSFRLLQISSLFIDESRHDVNALRYGTLGRSATQIPLSAGDCDTLLPPAPTSIDSEILFFDSLHTDDQGQPNGNTPSYRILNLVSEGPLTGLVTPRAFFRCTNDVNDDNLGAWLHRTPSQAMLARGERGSIRYRVVATADALPVPTTEIVLGLGRGAGGWMERKESTSPYAHTAWMRTGWPEYNDVVGESRPVACDVDGDGRDEIVVGLGSFPSEGGWIEVKADLAAGGAHLAWLRVNWPDYNSANGETFPACGDLDGDGRDEIVVGLGSGGGGWLKTFDDATTGFAALPQSPGGWILLGWSTYNAARGEVHPAIGNLDDDPAEELVLGLGAGGEGWLQILDDALSSFAPLTGAGVLPGGWLQVRSADSSGETWPATGDLGGPKGEELVVGLGAGGKGRVIVFGSSGYGPLVDRALDWPAYDDDVGRINPAVGDLDGDGRSELVLGLASYPTDGGWLDHWDDLDEGLRHLSWLRVGWSEYNGVNGLSRASVVRR